LQLISYLGGLSRRKWLIDIFVEESLKGKLFFGERAGKLDIEGLHTFIRLLMIKWRLISFGEIFLCECKIVFICTVIDTISVIYILLWNFFCNLVSFPFYILIRYENAHMLYKWLLIWKLCMHMCVILYWIKLLFYLIQ